VKKLLVVLVVSLLCCMSCGSDDGEPPSGKPPGSPPQIADLQCDPSSATVGDGNGATAVDCTVDFEDADMDLETIIVRVRRNCGGGSWQEFPTNVVAQAAGRTRGAIDFILTAVTDCPAGNYPHEVSARDSTNRVSNVLTLQFILDEPVL